MDTGQTYLVLESPIPSNLLPLGSLVHYLERPLDDCYVGLNIRDSTQIYWRVDRNVREVINNVDTTSLGQRRLQKLLSRSLPWNGDYLELGAIQCHVYGLINQLDLFHRLIDLPGAREQIQHGLNGGYNIYFVTGYRTFFHSQLTATSAASTTTTTPFDVITAAASVPIRVSVSRVVSSQLVNKFVTDDEMIFAVAYSQVNIRKLFGIGIASLKLSSKLHDKWLVSMILRKQSQSFPGKAKSVAKAKPQSGKGHPEILLIDEVAKATLAKATLDSGQEKVLQVEKVPDLAGSRAIYRPHWLYGSFPLLEIDPISRVNTSIESGESEDLVVEMAGDKITVHGDIFHTSVGVGSFKEQGLESDIDRSSVTSAETSFWSEFSEASASSIGNIPGAEEELFHLLLNEEDLQPLYEQIVGRHTGDAFERRYHQLLRLYSVELSQNASSRLEHLVVRFIRRSARRIASLVRLQIYLESGEDNEVIKGLLELVPENSEQLDQFLSQLGQPDTENPIDDASVDEQSDGSEVEDTELPGLPKLDQVQKFLTRGVAFTNLVFNLQLFATAPIHEEAKEDTPLKEERVSVAEPTLTVTNDAPSDDGSMADPLLEPSRYFGRLEGLEQEVVNYCQLQRLLNSSSSSDTVLVDPGLSDSGVAQTLNLLSGVMKGILDGFSCLQDAGFCDQEFSLIVQSPTSTDVIKVVPFSGESLVRLLDIDLDEVQNSLESIGSPTVCDLGEVANEVFDYFGFHFDRPDDFESSLRQFASLIWMLAFGLASYSGSHASAFNEKYFKEKPSGFKILVDERAHSNNAIILRRVNLACLDEFVGGPVWTFLAPERETAETANKTVLTSIRCLTDLWGPTRIAYSREEPGKVIRVEVERGTIARHGEASTSDDAVSCHWFKWGAVIPEDCKPFDENSMLMIGTQTMPNDLSELKPNTSCQRENGTLGEILQETSQKMDLGVIEASWGLDAVNFGLGISKVVVANFGGVFKPIPGRSRKALLLWEWANDNPDIRSLEVKIGLEISACTGNALRVPVWEIFRLNAIKDYVERVFPLQLPKSFARTPSFLHAFDRGFEAFESIWKSSEEFQASAVVIIRKLLQRLVFTGPTAKGDLLAWFVDRKQNGLLIYNCYRHKWIQLLVDSTRETALAVMSRRCLENDYPKCCKHNTTGEDLCTALRTAIFVEQPKQVRKVLHKANKKSTQHFPPPKLPPPSRQDSKAQEQLSLKLQRLVSFGSAKKKDSQRLRNSGLPAPITAAVAPNVAKPSIGATSDTATLATTSLASAPQLTIPLEEMPAVTLDTPANPPAVSTAANSTNTEYATPGNANSSHQEKPLQEPIPALLECNMWYKKLQMLKIPSQPSTRIYIIKLQEPALGQIVHAVTRSVLGQGAQSYKELTGDLEENEHLVQAWIM